MEMEDNRSPCFVYDEEMSWVTEERATDIKAIREKKSVALTYSSDVLYICR